jgi:3',5'-cyclic-AMP phosphodiesterase
MASRIDSLRVAHLSDLHLNGTFERRARFIGALDRAKRSHASHLILTGDLTAHGKPEQFRELAGVLTINWAGGLTIVPGNHDGAPGAFERTFGAVGAPVFLAGGGTILPIDSRVHRRALLFRATGKVGSAQLQKIDALTSSPSGPVIVALHHGPQRTSGALHYFEGLQDRSALLRLLGRSPLIHVLAGHDHRVLDVGGQIHVAASVATHPDPLRLYDIGTGVPSGFQIFYKSNVIGTCGVAGRALNL